MIRKIKYAFVSLAGVIAVILVASILLLASETGSRWLIHHEASSVPNLLTIKRVQGSILNGLSLYGIDYRVEQQHTSIEHVKLNLKPLALLGGKLHLHNVYMKGITYNAALKKRDSEKEAIQQLSGISLPLKVLIEDAQLERLVFRRGDSQHELDHLYLVVQIDQKGLQIRQFEAAGKDVNVNLKAHIKFLSPYPFKANVDWKARYPNGVKAHGICSINGDVDKIKFIHKLRDPFFVETRGEVNINSILTDSYQLSFKGDYTGQSLPSTHIQAWGQGNLKGFHIENLVVRTLGGEVSVNGNIDFKSSPWWELIVNGSNIDPGEHWSQWPGNLSLNTKVRGNLNAGTPTVILNEIELVGQLLKQPFQTTGNLTFSGKELTIEELRIRSGKNKLNLNGKTAGDLNLRFDLDIVDPIKLWPGISGHLQGYGVVKGTRNNPIGTINLEGNSMGYGEYTLQNLKANLVLDSKNTHQSNGRFFLTNLRVADEVFSNLSFNWVGDFKQHRVHVDFISTATQGELEFLGGCHLDNCELRVDKASFEIEKHGRWHLLEPVNLFLSYAEIKPFKACWVKEESMMCVDSSWSDASGWQAEGDISAPSLTFMIDLLKEVLNKEHLGWKKEAGY